MPTRTRPALCRGATALVRAGALTGLATAPAAAHDELISATPAHGSVLDAPPEQVELTFSAEPMAIGSEVRVTDSTGDSVTDGELEIVGRQVTQPVASTGATDETYRVVWRVVSSDGHPIEGAFTYQVGDGSTAPATPTSSPTEKGAAREGLADAQDSMSLWAVGAIGAAIALAALGILGFVRRRRT